MKNYKIISLFPILLLSLVLFGCTSTGNNSNSNSDSVSESISESVVEDNLEGSEDYVPNQDLLSKTYMVINVDTTLQRLMLKDMKSERRLLYYYNLDTLFFDKYGEYISVAGLYPGRVVEINSMDENGLIGSLHLSNIYWEFEKVTNYSIDTGRGVLTIGTTNYRITDSTMVLSDSFETDFSSVGPNDELRLTGIDKDISAVSVTTGHGTLSVINAEKFAGSLICIGNIYTLIKGDMEIEVPEGSYNVTVANNGYGGSIPVEIDRGGISTVDLSQIETEGAEKFCKLTFNIAVPNAIIKVDGTVVTEGEILEVKYGRHVLSVYAEGYESWTKYLYVNSETANIILDMNGEDAQGDSNSDSENNSDDKEDTDKTEKTEDEKRREVELEYLTTIRDTVANMLNNISL